MIISKKSLGQNFLIDKNIIKKIINTIDITNNNIVEIGPGLGALTEKILEKNHVDLRIRSKRPLKNNDLHDFNYTQK